MEHSAWWRRRIPPAGAASLAAVFLVPLLLVAPALRPGYVLSAADRALDWHLLSSARPAGWRGASNPLIGDTVMQFLPWRRFASDELRAGRVPYWNPHAFAGSPLLGNSQSAVFDPLTLPYLLVTEPSRATVWVALLRMWVAGLGTWLLARKLGTSPAGRAAAAVIYACGGFTVVWLLYPHVSSSCWFPFALLAAESLARRASRRALAGMSLALAAATLGGHVEVAFVAALATAGYLLLRRGQLSGWSWRSVAHSLAVVAGAGAITVAVAAVHVGPFLDALSQGSLAESRGSEAAKASSWPRPRFERIVLQAFPYLFGRPVVGEVDLAGLHTNFCEQSGAYASLLGLALAVIGVCAAPQRNPARVLAGLGGATWLAAAMFPPFPALARLIPPFDVLPLQRGVFVALLATAVLAGIGLDALTGGPARSSAVAHRIATASVCALAGIGGVLAVWLVAGAPGFEAVFRFLARSRAVADWFAGKHDLMITKFGAMAPRLAWLYVVPWLATTLGACVTLLAGRRRPWVGGAAVAVVAIDLLWFGHGHNPAIRAELAFPETPRLTELRRAAGEGRVLVLDWGLPPNLATYAGLDDIVGYDAIGRRRLELLLSYAGQYRRGPSHFRLGWFDRFESPVLDLLGVRAVATSRPRDVHTLRPLPTSRGFLFENPGALRRAFVPAEVVVAGDLAAAVRRVESDPRLADPTACVVVEGREDDGLVGGRGTVRWSRPEPARLELDATMDARGVVAIAESWDPGWRASVDGRPAPVVPCDLAVMAVPLPAGTHRLTLEFRPRGWRWAVGLSTLGALACLGLLLGTRRGALPPGQNTT